MLQNVLFVEKTTHFNSTIESNYITDTQMVICLINKCCIGDE